MGKTVNNVLGWLRSYSRSGEGKQTIFWGGGRGLLSSQLLQIPVLLRDYYWYTVCLKKTKPNICCTLL